MSITLCVFNFQLSIFNFQLFPHSGHPLPPFWTPILQNVFYCILPHSVSCLLTSLFPPFWTPIALILDMCIYSFQRTSRCFKTAVRHYSKPFWTLCRLPAVAGDSLRAHCFSFPIRPIRPIRPILSSPAAKNHGQQRTIRTARTASTAVRVSLPHSRDPQGGVPILDTTHPHFGHLRP